MWWAIIKYVGALVIGGVLSVILVDTVQAWPQDTAPKFIISEAKITPSYSCSGEFHDVRVSGEGSINACVTGKGVRVASYYPIQGAISRAISFPFDDVFYPLDLCTSFWGCSYSEALDTFTGLAYTESGEPRGVVYKNFAKNLKKYVQNGVTRYGLSETSPVFEIVHPSGSAFYAQNLATSSNGKWSILEVRNYGYYRINNETLDVRRVVAPGNTYSYYGANPSVQLAISNDGKAVAIMGERMSFSVTIVNDSCGDRLTFNTQTSFTGAVTSCRFLNTNVYDYAQNFVFGSKPRFSQDSRMLSFDMYPYMAESKRVTLFADSVDIVSQQLSQYLAIGDSFVSGEGEVDDSFYVGGAANKCHVSLRSYPYLLAQSWNYTAHNAACSGATTETAKVAKNSNSQLSQIEEIESRQPQLLTIGIGGNDAGLMGKLKTCIGVGTCEWANSATQRANTAAEIKNLYPKLKAFYGGAQAKAPGKVVVVGYPLIIASDEACLAGIGVLLDQTERRFMNEGIKYLNQVAKAAANDSGVEFVDTQDALKGSELCSLNFSQSMNGLAFGNDYPVVEALANIKVFGAESFHPNPTGHQKIAQTILTNDARIFTNTNCISCEGYVGPPEPSSYWDSGVASKNQNAYPFLNTALVKKGDMFEVSFPAMSFEPLTEVVIELHSTVLTLACVQAAADGSLKTVIEVGDFEAGYHTVHAIGQNSTGSVVDLYDFVVIDGDNTTVENSTPVMPGSPSIKPSISVAITSPARKTPVITGGSEVLGLATIPVPASSSTLLPKPTPDTTSDNESSDSSQFVVIAALAVSAISLFVAAYTYWYYRKKPPTYHKG